VTLLADDPTDRTDALPSPPLARHRSTAIGVGWIRGRVVLRATTITVDQIRTVELYTDEVGAQCVVVSAGRLRGVAVPVPALADDTLRHALRRLVVDADAAGASVQPAVRQLLAD
jgi:hypothetical protein